MSDVKFCDSCGTSLSLNDMFCHNCGKKQATIVENKLPATDENINQEVINDPALNNAELGTEKIEATRATGEQDTPSPKSQPETKGDESIVVENGSAVENKKPNEVKDTSQAKNESDKAIITDPGNAIPDYQQQEQKPTASQSQVTYQDQQQPQYQQAPIAQEATPVPAPKKKKFPWFFTVFWILTFAAVGIWGYFLLLDSNYAYPLFTVEAQRYVVFTVAVAVLIYTLSLKFTIKKLKAIPAILLVLFSIAVFVLFCLVELQDGNFLHDMVSNMVESVIPAFGE